MEEKYFDDAGFTLWLGDCVKVLSSLPEGVAGAIFADPPYMLSNGGFSVSCGKAVSVNKGDWDKSLGVEKDYDFHLSWLRACRRVLRPGGTIWISGTYHSIYQCGYALQSLGFHVLNDIAWFKPNASPNLACRCFTASHETILWARREKETKHTFNYSVMKEGDWPEDLIKKPGKQMRSVWSVPPPRKEEKAHGKHPTQKPLALLERIILASTKKGDTILDPFAGSSTTGIAALKHGRRFIGIDSEKKYLDISISRAKDFLDRS